MVRALFLSALFISSSALACKDLGPISDPNEPFRAEAAAGCVENLKILLGFPGLRVNGTDSSARTALILAAQNGQGETVAFLVEKTTSLPNLQDYSGNTALHYGAQSGNGLIVQALLRYPNTDPNILNKRGTSPFELALLSRSENAWMPFLQSPRLDKKAVYALHVAAKVGSINMMAKLLEAGYDVNDLGAGRWNTTVLRIAAESKNIELVQALLSVPGIDVNRGPADHSTLERAVWQSNNL
ncbi:MAG: ankyrin repeat domain-containing protein, partial [Bdellovibrionota bacterium]